MQLLQMQVMELQVNCKGRKMKRYHPALVELHWILVIGILMLLWGGTGLAGLEADDPIRAFGMKGHMIFANVVLLLMTVRLIIRGRTAKPADADIGNELLNKGAKLAHYGLYLLVFAMAASGWAMAIMAGLPGIFFGDSGAPIPEDLTVYSPRVAHGIFSKILMLLIASHFVAALYHQFVRKDGLMSRMWFGKRD